MHCIFSNIPTEILLRMLSSDITWENDNDYYENVIYRDIPIKFKFELEKAIVYQTDYSSIEFWNNLSRAVEGMGLEQIVDYVIEICEPYWKMSLDEYNEFEGMMRDGIGWQEFPYKSIFENAMWNIYKTMNSDDYREEIKRTLIYEYLYIKSMELNENGKVKEFLSKEKIRRISNNDGFYKWIKKMYDKNDKLLYPKIFIDGMESKIWLNSIEENKISPSYELESQYDLELFYVCMHSSKYEKNPFAITNDLSDNKGCIDIEKFLTTEGNMFTLDGVDSYLLKRMKEKTEYIKDDCDTYSFILPYINDYLLERLFVINFGNEIIKMEELWGEAYSQLMEMLKRFYLSPFLINRLTIVGLHKDIINNDARCFFHVNRFMHIWCRMLDVLLKKQIYVTMPILSVVMFYIIGRNKNNMDNVNVRGVLESINHPLMFKKENDILPFKTYPKEKNEYNKKMSMLLMKYCMDMMVYKKSHMFTENTREEIYKARLCAVQNTLMSEAKNTVRWFSILSEFFSP